MTRLLPALLGALLLCAFSPPVRAQDGAPLTDEEVAELQRQFEASLTWQTGEIELGDGVAKLSLPDSLRYLGPADAERVIVDAWGNPSGDGTLGMLFPADYGPFDAASWGVIITYEEDGYVQDDDASDLDYDEMLAAMQEQTRASNEARNEAGYESIELVGWATPPHYDSAAKKLYWAKELAFEGNPTHTLNYNVRILGRRGVLVLNTVADMGQLDLIESETPLLLESVDFNPGHQYADFDPEVDKIAAYGIGALIAGKVALKAGLFKGLLAALFAAKKLVIVAVVGIGAFVAKLFGRGKTAEA